MPSKQIIEEIQINEGNDYTLPFIPDEDLTGSNLSVRLRASNASSGTGTEVGTASGGSAGTKIDISLATSGESPDEYDLEIRTDSNEVIYPNPSEIVRFVIRDRYSVTN